MSSPEASCALCRGIEVARYTENHHAAAPYCSKCGREIPVIRVEREDYVERVAAFAQYRTPNP